MSTCFNQAGGKKHGHHFPSLTLPPLKKHHPFRPLAEQSPVIYALVLFILVLHTLVLSFVAHLFHHEKLYGVTRRSTWTCPSSPAVVDHTRSNTVGLRPPVAAPVESVRSSAQQSRSVRPPGIRELATLVGEGKSMRIGDRSWGVSYHYDWEGYIYVILCNLNRCLSSRVIERSNSSQSGLHHPAYTTHGKQYVSYGWLRKISS